MTDYLMKISEKIWKIVGFS